jgi:hypothetical protein
MPHHVVVNNDHLEDRCLMAWRFLECVYLPYIFFPQVQLYYECHGQAE